MTDITTTWDVARSRGDWVIAGAALASGSDLATTVLISLFTDRSAADDDELPDNSGNRRGWWGDEGEDVPMGSRLWLLERSKLTQSVANRAVEYAREALAWMISDGVVRSVDASATIVPRNQLRLLVTITRGDGSQLALSFAWAWQDMT